MTLRKVISEGRRCDFVNLEFNEDGSVYAILRRVDHQSPARALRTSRVRSIDFEAGICVTQNSVYLFKPIITTGD